MENKGWVKLHRKLLDNPVMGDPDYLAVWVHLLLTACHKETSFIWNGKKKTLKPGQLLTGRKALSKATGVQQSKIYRALSYLESEQQIEQLKTNKYTIISILNWDKYQHEEQKREQQVSNKRATGEQQMSTYKNDKKEKNIKNIYISSLEGAKNSVSILSEESTILELATSLKTDAVVVKNEVEKMTDWLKSNGKRYKDYKAFARNWIRRSLEAKNTPKKNTFVSLD